MLTSIVIIERNRAELQCNACGDRRIHKSTMKPTKRSFGKAVRGLAIGLATSMVASYVAQATPFASCITNNGGTIQFYLNEGADNVGVSFDNNTATNNLGALSKGLQSFLLTPHTNYSIWVYKVGAGGPTLINDTNAATSVFGSGRGIAANTNPKSPYFGRIYAANAGPAGSLATGTYKGRGIYLYNSDLSDALGRSTNASGRVFSGDSLSPNRLFVAADGTLYVSDGGLTASTIWQFDPNVIAFTNQILGAKGDADGIATGIHGRIASTPNVQGSIATGDLTIWNTDATLTPTFNDIKRYDIATGPVPWSNAPATVVNLGFPTLGSTLTQPSTDLSLSPDGTKLFASFYRFNNAIPALQVFDLNGTRLFDTMTDSGLTIGIGPDPIQGAFGCRVSPDNKYVVVVDVSNNMYVMSLTNGIPDLASLYKIASDNTVGNHRQIGWDAADNILSMSSGQGQLRVYSLGFTTMAITSNDQFGTNGTFQWIGPSTQVYVTGVVTNASQSGPVSGVITLTRTNANNDYSAAATVNFTLTGTATNGTYTVSPAGITPATGGSVTFAVGQSTTNITITPVNDGKARPTTTVTLNLKGGATYSAVNPSSATVEIQNTGPQLLFVSAAAAPTMYKGHLADYASFIITRWGDTNAAPYTVSSFTYGGTAVQGVDFIAAQPITINPGDASATNRVHPLASSTSYQGNKTIVIGVGAGGGYTTGGANTATLTLLDNANPPATVLYSNPLTSAADAANWGITFGNGDVTNNPADYNVDFGYDVTTDPTGTYGTVGLPPNGASKVLRLTCNKLFNPGSAAGVNVYLTNQAFSGDYAVRFNMNLIQGSASAYSTEGVLFGINHGGAQSNWFYGSGPLFGGPWGSDGIWYWVSADPGGASAGDFVEFTGTGGSLPNAGWAQLGSQAWTTFQNAFKVPDVYTTVEGTAGGVPANSSSLLGLANTNWADVEIKQVKNVVTLTIDKTRIFTYTNTTTFTSGYLMLGYNDPYGGTGGASVGNPDAAAYFSNLRVVRLTGPTITSIANSGTNVVMTFTSTDGNDTAASFLVQSAATITGTFADISPAATVTQLANGSYQTTVAKSGSALFYRIKRR